MKYKVRVKKIITAEDFITANSKEEAYEKAEELCNEGEIFYPTFPEINIEIISEEDDCE